MLLQPMILGCGLDRDLGYEAVPRVKSRFYEFLIEICRGKFVGLCIIVV
ncbi:hypothetical protein DSOL_3608 [Desulfosporosinus metallidurans]|uniref:Uncharacterized protein n=1 Tax=Desulfosporosinus metallidurans TaxID=1888891 RepID=A0A1Q8QPJ5_9FIRM|nr:hypothetical protein DSOL_3608 [Desulfosporosinus metallidurans]